MTTNLSTGFGKFFYFFSHTFVGVTALRFIKPPTQCAYYDTYYWHTVFIMPYVIHIFVYTYTISDGNTFVNTFCKNNYVFFQVQYVIHIISSLTLTDRQIRRWALALIYYYRSILCYSWGSTVKVLPTPFWKFLERRLERMDRSPIENNPRPTLRGTSTCFRGSPGGWKVPTTYPPYPLFILVPHWAACGKNRKGMRRIL